MRTAILAAALMSCDGEAECAPILPSFECDYSNHETYQCDGCGETSSCACARPGVECEWGQSNVPCRCIDDDFQLDESREGCSSNLEDYDPDD